MNVPIRILHTSIIESLDQQTVHLFQTTLNIESISHKVTSLPHVQGEYKPCIHRLP